MATSADPGGDKFGNVSKVVLDINNLQDVISACQECAVKWNPVGLRLGLSHGQLEVIAAKTDDPNERFQSVLAAWLKKDCLPGHPSPSYYTLCHAIASTTGGGDPALAERIAKEHLAPVSALYNQMESFETDADSISSASAGYYTDDDLHRLCSCGECSLEQIITKGCPVTGAASLHRYPLLDVTRLHEGKRQQYIYMIEKETLTINAKFARLYDNISEEMKNIPVPRLKRHLLLMRWFDWAVDSHTLHDKLEHCEDTESVFSVLSKICSWFNHHPLAPLIEQFGSANLSNQYGDFVDKTLMNFLKRSITEIPKDGLGDVIEGSKKFQLKMKTNTAHQLIRADSIIFLRTSIAEKLEVSEEHLHILSFDAGCIEVTIMIPKVLYKELFPLSVKHAEALKTIAVPIDECYSLTIVSITDDELRTTMLVANDSPLLKADDNLKSTANQALRRLSQLVLPMELVHLLYTEGGISKEILQDVQSLGGVFSSSSMEALCITMSKDPAILRVIGTVLLKSEVTVPLANDLFKECEHPFPKKSAFSHFQVALLAKGTPNPDIGQSTKEAVPGDKIQILSPITFIKSLVIAAMPNIAEVKNFLCCAFQEMSAQLAHAETADDVLMLVEENCSIDNVYCLETLIDRYNIKKAKAALEDYKAEIDRVFKETNVSDCLDDSFRFSSSSHLLLKCESVEFCLSLEFLHCPLEKIKDLQLTSFNGFANRVLMESMHQKEESIVVTCFAPRHLMNTLQLEAKRSSDELKQKGVMSLTLGYYMLFEPNTDASNERSNDIPKNLDETQDEEKATVLTPQESLTKQLSHAKSLEIEKLKVEHEKRLTDMKTQLAIQEQMSNEKIQSLKQIILNVQKRGSNADSKDPTNFDQLLKSIGVQTENIELASSVEAIQGHAFFSHQLLREIVVNPDITIKVRPILISFSGLPESGKTTAFTTYAGQLVKNPFIPTSMTARHQESEGISHYDLIAFFDPKYEEKPRISEATKESSCMLGLLSAFKQHLLKKGEILLLEDASDRLLSLKCSDHQSLNNHFQKIYQYLCNSLPTSLEDEETKYAYTRKLEKLLPKESAFINLWDIPTNKTVNYFLSALEGYLTNNHMCLFLQLDMDLDNLQKPPRIGKHKRDGAILTRWYSRLHYLLASCRLSENREKGRREVCTIFAKHGETSNADDFQIKLDRLKNAIESAAKHMSVGTLLMEDCPIETIGTDIQNLSQKIQKVITDTQPVDIPIAWVFLRSLFHCQDGKFIHHDEFKALAEECGMDEQSQEKFLKFYTSFGSIFGVSLINSQYQYVIVKPMHFLKSLDSLLYPSKDVTGNHPTIRCGIVSRNTCNEILGEDWSAYVDALVCLNLATKVAVDCLKMPDDCSPLDPTNTYYYIPFSRIGPLIDTPDPSSIHVITSVNTPDVFNQVAFTKHLMAFLPQSKIIAGINSNQTIIKDISSDTTVTFVSYGPVSQLHLDKANGEVCSAVVRAYDEIAKSSQFAVKYKFVLLCADNNIPNARFLPSARYHVLPDDSLCEKCDDSGKVDNQILKVWNETLKQHPIKDEYKPSGRVPEKEIAFIAYKIASYDMRLGQRLDTNVIAATFGFSEYKTEQTFEGLTREDLVTKLIIEWDRKHQTKRGSQEPRRALARKLFQLGENLSKNCGSEIEKQSMKEKFEKLANEVDLYYIADGST